VSILLFINLKGGVAKTTNAVAVAECLADSGYRTLLIDADHQCTSSELLLGEGPFLKCDPDKAILHDLLSEMLDDQFRPEQFPAFVVPGVSDIGNGLDDLSVMPCSMRIDDFQTNMAKARRGFKSAEEFLAVFRRRRDKMRKWLMASYDFTIVDCPPSLALQVKFFLALADAYIVPAVPDRLSVRGSLLLQRRIRSLGIKVQGLGTLWSLYRQQNKVHRKVVDATAEGIKPLDTMQETTACRQ
jgi:chromosome partitioning protein